MEDEKDKKNVTKYGEFVPTFHAWVGLEKQKNITKKLENIGKSDKNKDK